MASFLRTSSVKEVNPLKQGLKHTKTSSQVPRISSVKEVNPLKQGLKQTKLFRNIKHNRRLKK